MVKEIISLYRSQYDFKEFYDRLLFNIQTWPDYHIKKGHFLEGFQPSLSIIPFEERIKTSNGDIRVDLPIWFGPCDSKEKVVIFGMEPRDTDKEGYLNIEKVGKFVYGTPFALERPGGKYHLAFEGLIGRSDCFVYLSDVVKEYEVGSSKRNDDKNARQKFREKAIENKKFLISEVALIKPTRIIALGNEAYELLSEVYVEDHLVHKIRHPSRGGSRIARDQLTALMNVSA